MPNSIRISGGFADTFQSDRPEGVFLMPDLTCELRVETLMTVAESLLRLSKTISLQSRIRLETG